MGGTCPPILFRRGELWGHLLKAEHGNALRFVLFTLGLISALHGLTFLRLRTFRGQCGPGAFPATDPKRSHWQAPAARSHLHGFPAGLHQPRFPLPLYPLQPRQDLGPYVPTCRSGFCCPVGADFGSCVASDESRDQPS